LNYKNNECNPYYFSEDVNSSDLSKYAEYLKVNGVKLEDNKEIDENKKEFISNNFKVKLFYGKEGNLVNSDYSLIVDENNKFKVSENKIYVGEIISELNDYSFVEIDKNLIGYNVGTVVVDSEKFSAFEREKIKDYSGEIKKYLMRNKEKFKDLKLIDKVIDLL